ncbi:hypothetical protein P8452_00553 [Trifolium repens]|nr:hypothetical protein P8452_00553 [Trifolium repens]
MPSTRDLCLTTVEIICTFKLIYSSSSQTDKKMSPSTSSSNKILSPTGMKTVTDEDAKYSRPISYYCEDNMHFQVNMASG